MIIQIVPRHGQRVNVQMLEKALLDTAPFPASQVKIPDHSPEVLLVMYGCGSPDRTAMINRHRAVGGNVICFDRGYFGRSSNGEDEHYRVAINELHVSPKHIEATEDNQSRFNRFSLDLREDSVKSGHVVVVGMGLKSRKGLNLFDWEKKALEGTQKRFPGRRVMYRPKYSGAKRVADSVRWRWVDSKSPIDMVLKGASLCIVRHSNVAVDACVAGIPVECEDGAARWLYQSGPVQPVERRLSFVRRLAWWNWQVNEMEQAWKFLLPRLS